jgi:hypothetical protein
MTTAELRKATKQFDEEFVADKSRPLTRAERALWDRVRRKAQRETNGAHHKTITVRLEQSLLERSAALAKKRRISRDALIARGLRLLLAAQEDR